MSYFIIESFGSTNTGDDIGLVLLMVVPVLLVIGFILFIVGILNKQKKPKIFKTAALFILAAGVSAIIGLGQCGWY